MTVTSEGLPLNSKYIKMGREEGGFPSFPHTATPCNCLPCGLTVIHLRLCDSSLWTLARSQPPIFLHQVEDCDRRCQSDLGIL